MDEGDLNQLFTMNQDGNVIHNVIVKGKLVVQVVSYRDISISMNTIQKRINDKKKKSISNSNSNQIMGSNSSDNRLLSVANGNEGDEENDGEEEDEDSGEFEFGGDKNSKIKGKGQKNRMYKVWLSDDGQRQIIGLEYTRMMCFDAIRIGARYEITNAIMKRGMLMLTDKNTKLLGYFTHPPMKSTSVIDTFAENIDSSSAHLHSIFQTPILNQQQNQSQQQISKQSNTFITLPPKPAAKSSLPAPVEIIDDDDFE